MNARLILGIELVTRGAGTGMTFCLRQNAVNWSMQVWKDTLWLFLSFLQWHKCLVSIDFGGAPSEPLYKLLYKPIYMARTWEVALSDSQLHLK